MSSKALVISGGVFLSCLILSLVFVKGVYPVCGWRQADRWHSRETSPGVGFEEHGLRTAKERVQSQVSDSLHQGLPQQTGTFSIKVNFMNTEY